MMKRDVFELNPEQLKDIATSFQDKVEKGLKEDGAEIQCLPTFITPRASIDNGRALVLDLGGTNYRAAIVEFKDHVPKIRPQDAWNKKLDVMKNDGFTQQELHEELADLISEINPNQELPIGYCFSYPAESMLNGDAKLIRWTKGVHIKEMIGQPVGQPLMDYLNERGIARFTSIKVINDTVASLFAGLTQNGYDAYIGLIVGTGTNMATFVPQKNIRKLNGNQRGMGVMPVNLESGNFYPPHLTDIDNLVDELSDSRDRQRFEKAVSGMYLGEIFKVYFPNESQREGFSAKDLNQIVSNPEYYRTEYVDVAQRILQRSALLVAASLTGLVLTLRKYDDRIRRVCLTAEGSLFWSKTNGKNHYCNTVMAKLHELLADFGYGDITVDVSEKKNINLVGTAIAALSDTIK